MSSILISPFHCMDASSKTVHQDYEQSLEWIVAKCHYERRVLHRFFTIISRILTSKFKNVKASRHFRYSTLKLRFESFQLLINRERIRCLADRCQAINAFSHFIRKIKKKMNLSKVSKTLLAPLIPFPSAKYFLIRWKKYTHISKDLQRSIQKKLHKGCFYPTTLGRWLKLANNYLSLRSVSGLLAFACYRWISHYISNVDRVNEDSHIGYQLFNARNSSPFSDLKETSILPLSSRIRYYSMKLFRATERVFSLKIGIKALDFYFLCQCFRQWGLWVQKLSKLKKYHLKKFLSLHFYSWKKVTSARMRVREATSLLHQISSTFMKRRVVSEWKLLWLEMIHITNTRRRRKLRKHFMTLIDNITHQYGSRKCYQMVENRGYRSSCLSFFIRLKSLLFRQHHIGIAILHQRNFLISKVFLRWTQWRHDRYISRAEIHIATSRYFHRQLHRWKKNITMHRHLRYSFCTLSKKIAIRSLTTTFGNWVMVTLMHHRLQSLYLKINMRTSAKELWLSWQAWQRMCYRSTMIRQGRWHEIHHNHSQSQSQSQLPSPLLLLSLHGSPHWTDERDRDNRRLHSSSSNSNTFNLLSSLDSQKMKGCAFREWASKKWRTRPITKLLNVCTDIICRKLLLNTIRYWSIKVVVKYHASICIQRRWRGWQFRSLYGNHIVEHLSQYTIHLQKALQWRQSYWRRLTWENWRHYFGAMTLCHQSQTHRCDQSRGMRRWKTRLTIAGSWRLAERTYIQRRLRVVMEQLAALKARRVWYRALRHIRQRSFETHLFKTYIRKLYTHCQQILVIRKKQHSQLLIVLAPEFFLLLRHKVIRRQKVSVQVTTKLQPRQLKRVINKFLQYRLYHQLSRQKFHTCICHRKIFFSTTGTTSNHNKSNGSSYSIPINLLYWPSYYYLVNWRRRSASVVYKRYHDTVTSQHHYQHYQLHKSILLWKKRILIIKSRLQQRRFHFRNKSLTSTSSYHMFTPSLPLSSNNRKLLMPIHNQHTSTGNIVSAPSRSKSPPPVVVVTDLSNGDHHSMDRLMRMMMVPLPPSRSSYYINDTTTTTTMSATTPVATPAAAAAVIKTTKNAVSCIPPKSLPFPPTPATATATSYHHHHHPTSWTLDDDTTTFLRTPLFESISQDDETVVPCPRPRHVLGAPVAHVELIAVIFSRLKRQCQWFHSLRNGQTIALREALIWRLRRDVSRGIHKLHSVAINRKRYQLINVVSNRLRPYFHRWQRKAVTNYEKSISSSTIGNMSHQRQLYLPNYHPLQDTIIYDKPLPIATSGSGSGGGPAAGGPAAAAALRSRDEWIRQQNNRKLAMMMSMKWNLPFPDATRSMASSSSSSIALAKRRKDGGKGVYSYSNRNNTTQRHITKSIKNNKGVTSTTTRGTGTITRLIHDQWGGKIIGMLELLPSQIMKMRQSLRFWAYVTRRKTTLIRVCLKMWTATPWLLWKHATRQRLTLKRKLYSLQVRVLCRLAKEVIQAWRLITCHQVRLHLQTHYLSNLCSSRLKRKCLVMWTLAIRKAQEDSLCTLIHIKISKKIIARCLSIWIVATDHKLSTKDMQRRWRYKSYQLLLVALSVWRDFLVVRSRAAAAQHLAQLKYSCLRLGQGWKSLRDYKASRVVYEAKILLHESIRFRRLTRVHLKRLRSWYCKRVHRRLLEGYRASQSRRAAAVVEGEGEGEGAGGGKRRGDAMKWMTREESLRLVLYNQGMVAFKRLLASIHQWTLWQWKKRLFKSLHRATRNRKMETVTWTTKLQYEVEVAIKRKYFRNYLSGIKFYKIQRQARQSSKELMLACHYFYWKRRTDRRNLIKASLSYIVKCSYQCNIRWYWRIWKVTIGPCYRLSHSILMHSYWYQWNQSLALQVALRKAVRYSESMICRRVWTGWIEWRRSVHARLTQRNRMRKLMTAIHIWEKRHERKRMSEALATWMKQTIATTGTTRTSRVTVLVHPPRRIEMVGTLKENFAWRESLSSTLVRARNPL